MCSIINIYLTHLKVTFSMYRLKKQMNRLQFIMKKGNTYTVAHLIIHPLELAGHYMSWIYTNRSIILKQGGIMSANEWKVYCPNLPPSGITETCLFFCSLNYNPQDDLHFEHRFLIYLLSQIRAFIKPVSVCGLYVWQFGVSIARHWCQTLDILHSVSWTGRVCHELKMKAKILKTIMRH